MQESRRERMMWTFEPASTISTMKNTSPDSYRDNHPVELSTIEMFNQRLDYLQIIRLNPVRWRIRRIIYIAVQ
jgi:hypothetical protein